MRKAPLRTARLLVILIVAVSLLAAWTRSAEALTVKSLHIIGKNDNSGIDTRIPASVREALKSAFGSKYNSYRLHSTAVRSARMGKTTTIGLPGGLTLLVTPIRAEGEGAHRRITLQVRITKGGARILNVTVDLRPGRYCLLGGPSVDGGDLIVALAVLE